jgi:hypothetical protein
MARTKYKQVTLTLLQKLDKEGGINCTKSKRYETCEWNRKVRYDNSGLYCINEAALTNICVKCLLKDIENVIKE